MGEIGYNDMFDKGDHVILQLLNGDIFEGNYCDGGKTRIDLINTKQHNNENELGGVYSFYKNEIENIRILKTKLTEKPILEEIDTKNKINIVEEEYHRLKQMAIDYTYIDKADKRYYDAVNKLINAETIGVVPLGMEHTRNARIKLLVLSTWREVYLFDLAEHKNRYFYPELKEILESEYICKVIHKGSPFVDLLYRNYKIYVQNTFDTQVVDLILQKTKTGQCPTSTRDLSECLTYYFNLPSSLIKKALKSEKKFMERPLSDKYKLYASQLVTYLVILKGQMEKMLLSVTHKTINSVHDLYYNLSSYEYAVCCQKNVVSKDMAELIPSLNALGLKEDTKENTNSKE